METRLITYIGGFGFLLTALIIFVLGWRDFRKQRAFMRQSVKTTGTVVGVHTEAGGLDNTSTSFFPTIRFSAANGREVTFTSRYGGTRQWQDGEVVAVRYQPEQPEQAEFDSFFGIWLITIMCAVLGIASLASGLMVLLLPPVAD